jgi:hypothetical protein
MSNWITDLPNWLVAIGTVGAFGTGGAVLLRELNRDHERQETAERRQASSVAAWPIRTESIVDSLNTIKAQLVLNNSSNEPVYHVTIEYINPSSNEPMSDELDILPPGRYERELPRKLQETWVRTEEGWVKRGSPAGSSTSKPLHQPWSFSLAICFVDASGRHWRREADGSLTRQ